MKIFINYKNISTKELGEIITNAFPELHCSIDDEIVIRKTTEDPVLVTISMQGNYGKVKVIIDSTYTENIFEIIGHSLTMTKDYTTFLITCAEQFNNIPYLRIELINDYNLVLLIKEETALRLKLWLKSDGKNIDMLPAQNDGGKIIRNFVERDKMFSAKLQIMHSGNLIKYIAELE